MIKNIQITVEAVFCDECGKDLESYNGFPYVTAGEKHYCLDCAYKLKEITKKEFFELHGICVAERLLKNVEMVRDEE